MFRITPNNSSSTCFLIMEQLRHPTSLAGDTYALSGSLNKDKIKGLDELLPFPPNTNVTEKKKIISLARSIFNKKKSIDDLSFAAVDWIRSWSDSSLEDLFVNTIRSDEDADKMECIYTLRHWCVAMKVTSGASIDECRANIREANLGAGVVLPIPSAIPSRRLEPTPQG